MLQSNDMNFSKKRGHIFGFDRKQATSVDQRQQTKRQFANNTDNRRPWETPKAQ